MELAGQDETGMCVGPAKELFKVSYDSLKTHLLFHENTTLRNVLEDVILNVRKQLAGYFGTLQNKESPSGHDIVVR